MSGSILPKNSLIFCLTTDLWSFKKELSFQCRHFLKTCCLEQCTGDQTPLRVCHTIREKQHKTFKNIAPKGHSSTGYFFGFKLHVIINDKEEILDFMFTQANVDDRDPLKNRNFHMRIFEKLFGDKGYISKTYLNNFS